MSIKPDIIVTWPRNSDYPLWRHFIRKNRALFGKVIVSFMETNQGYDYREFVMPAMRPDDITFLPATIPGPGEDWRDVSVNNALKHSDSEWVWFTEQDFFATDTFFNEAFLAVEKGAEVIGVLDGDRLHPCSIMIKREILEKTGKNFGIDTERRLDHFGRLQLDLAEIKAYTAIINTGYTHMAGLSHNFSLVSNGMAPNYKVSEFVAYLKQCLEVDIELEPNFFEIATGVIKVHG